MTAAQPINSRLTAVVREAISQFLNGSQISELQCNDRTVA
jgi:hypothetical protein